MSLRRLSLSLLAASALIAGCGGGSHPSVVPAAGSVTNQSGTTMTPTANAQKAQSESHRAHAHHVAFLIFTVDAKGSGTFSFAKGDLDDVLYSSAQKQSVPVPAFTLACASHGEHAWGRHRCAIHSDDDDHDSDDQRNYYVRQIAIPQWRSHARSHAQDDDNDFDDWSTAIVTGPQTATTRTSIDLPAANAPVGIDAGTTYVFDLIRTRDTLATPTPPPTPAPADPCPTLTNYSPLSPPKTITATAGTSSAITAIPQTIAGKINNISCAVGGKMYFTAKLFFSGSTYQLDPATATVSQWSTVAGDETVTGGDGLVYEQGSFGKSKLSQLAQFSADGTTQKFVGGGLPHLMVTGPDGNVYTVISNGTSDVVQQVKPDDSVTTFALPSACGTSIDADASGAGGKLWFHGSSCGIISMTTQGSYATVASLTDTVNHLATGPDGAVYATDVTNGSIVRIDPASGATATWQLPANLRPNGLVRGNGPDLWFDAYNSTTNTYEIDVMNLKTGAITEFDQGNASLSSSYTIGPDGNIYTFVFKGSNTLLRISGSAKF